MTCSIYVQVNDSGGYVYALYTGMGLYVRTGIGVVMNVLCVPIKEWLCTTRFSYWFGILNRQFLRTTTKADVIDMLISYYSA